MQKRIISLVPSCFVKNTFIEKGFDDKKIFVNPFGAADFFAPAAPVAAAEKRKFVILYLGTLSIRKGLSYLFEALNMLALSPDDFEVWFIGSVEDALKTEIEKHKKTNWKFFGHINHYDLPSWLSQCDVGIQVSLEEGLSMVIPQMMASGIPVIITPNTGGENILEDRKSGWVVPVRDPAAIAEKITLLFNNRPLLNEMKSAAREVVSNGFTWDDYGNRYVNFLEGVQ